LPPADFLAISGGGEDGAFGAGLLVGWSAAGTRPRFKGVTGISTGALTAPFAFLGPAYDSKLREVYTTIAGKDILRSNGLLDAVFFNDSWQTPRRCEVLSPDTRPDGAGRDRRGVLKGTRPVDRHDNSMRDTGNLDIA
jgi:hypothetical protein